MDDSTLHSVDENIPFKKVYCAVWPVDRNESQPLHQGQQFRRGVHAALLLQRQRPHSSQTLASAVHHWSEFAFMRVISPRSSALTRITIGTTFFGLAGPKYSRKAPTPCFLQFFFPCHLANCTKWQTAV